MTYLKSLVIACVLTLGFLIPIATPTVAKASPTRGHQRIYWVYYRSSPQSSWVCYGGYYCSTKAGQAVNYFRSRGYDSYYR